MLISSPSFLVRTPANSSIDLFFVSLFTTSVKLSFVFLRAASLSYASSEMEMFLVPTIITVWVCVCTLLGFSIARAVGVLVDILDADAHEYKLFIQDE